MSDEQWRIGDKAGLAEAIRRMGEEDLRYLSQLIWERLKLIQQAKSTSLMAAFHTGDRVAFQAQAGPKTGVIQKLNKKTASVKTDDGQNWNVHPGFLKRLGGGGAG